MGLLDWFRQSFTENEDSIVKAVSKEALLSGFDIKKALDADMVWKEKLQDVLDGASVKELNIADASQDNLCILGKWIYGRGKYLYSHLPEYEVFRKAHAEFHLCAGEVLAEHLAGNEVKAAKLFNNKFRTATNKNRLELVRLISMQNRSN